MGVTLYPRPTEAGNIDCYYEDCREHLSRNQYEFAQAEHPLPFHEISEFLRFRPSRLFFSRFETGNYITMHLTRI